MDIVPQCKPSIQSRFSILRYMKVVKKINTIQRSFISKHDLDNLLKLPDHLMVPMNLLQWTSHGEEKVFLHKEKNINFSKERNRNIVSIQENTMKYIGDGIPIGMSYDGSPVTNTTGTNTTGTDAE
nr:uncharacterized protein LOC127325955 [Lolium perenne]